MNQKLIFGYDIIQFTDSSRIRCLPEVKVAYDINDSILHTLKLLSCFYYYTMSHGCLCNFTNIVGFNGDQNYIG